MSIGPKLVHVVDMMCSFMTLPKAVSFYSSNLDCYTGVQPLKNRVIVALAVGRFRFQMITGTNNRLTRSYGAGWTGKRPQ